MANWRKGEAVRNTEIPQQARTKCTGGTLLREGRLAGGTGPQSTVPEKYNVNLRHYVKCQEKVKLVLTDAFQYIQKVIISTCDHYKTFTDEIFSLFLFFLSIQNAMCIPHSEHISVQSGHISRAQESCMVTAFHNAGLDSNTWFINGQKLKGDLG